jgi:small-conductance mechanosensitive channel
MTSARSKKRMHGHQSLVWAVVLLTGISALYPWPGNTFALIVFGAALRPPNSVATAFGIVWWIVGAWIVKSLLSRILRRTIFPNDDQPHARRLFADLASGLVYVVAFVGIMDTVLKEPISTMLATSGVLAIVLGLALQNTLADVFSGLAINIERPFGAGDWITATDDVEGQVIEINWRATRIRTLVNDIVVIPNSVAAKTVVTNHRPLNEWHLCAVMLTVDQSFPIADVVGILESAASGATGVPPGSKPAAYANAVMDSMIEYRLTFAVPAFSRTAVVRSAVLASVVAALSASNIPLGATETWVRLVGEKP